MIMMQCKQENEILSGSSNTKSIDTIAEKSYEVIGVTDKTKSKPT